MSEIINALVPFVEIGIGVSLFLGISAMVGGWLVNAFTGNFGRGDRGRFF